MTIDRAGLLFRADRAKYDFDHAPIKNDSLIYLK